MLHAIEYCFGPRRETGDLRLGLSARNRSNSVFHALPARDAHPEALVVVWTSALYSVISSDMRNPTSAMYLHALVCIGGLGVALVGETAPRPTRGLRPGQPGDRPSIVRASSHSTVTKGPRGPRLVAQ